MEKVSTPHLLVIGGTGFIGHHLLRVAHQKNWQNTSVSLQPPSNLRLVEGVRYLHFDLTELENAKKYLNENFDYVVNLGGYINHQNFREGGRTRIETHFNSLQNLVEVLPRQRLKRFVQIGSSDEYGNAPAPQYEDQREQAISPYSLAKTACTHFLQMLHRTEKFPAVTLRLFLTYGPGQDTKRFLPQIIQGCLNNEIFPTSGGEQLRDFCYIDDTVSAIIKTLTKTGIEGDVLNVASGEAVPIRTIIEKVCMITRSGRPKFGEIAYRPGENMALYADISKVREILDWEPTISLDVGLKKTISFFTDNYV